MSHIYTFFLIYQTNANANHLSLCKMLCETTNQSQGKAGLYEVDEQEAKAPLNVVVVFNLIFVRLCLRLMSMLLDSAKTR